MRTVEKPKFSEKQEEADITLLQKKPPQSSAISKRKKSLINLDLECVTYVKQPIMHRRLQSSTINNRNFMSSSLRIEDSVIRSPRKTPMFPDTKVDIPIKVVPLFIQ